MLLRIRQPINSKIRRKGVVEAVVVVVEVVVVVVGVVVVVVKLLQLQSTPFKPEDTHDTLKNPQRTTMITSHRICRMECLATFVSDA